MKKFLPIIQDFERYPVFYDQSRQVLSLPPIINSEATKITLDTTDVFVEITATDLLKAKTCLAVLAAQFSEYCSGGFQHKVEQVEIKYEKEPSRNELTPDMKYDDFNIEMEYINRILGVKIDAQKAAKCAEKMGLVLKGSAGNSLQIEIPPTRSDILHPCDLIEDIGIGYGFNNIPKVFPANNTVGSFQPNNKMTDHMRHELAQSGYIESLNFALLSLKDNYTNMRQEVDFSECVQLSNPKTIEFEIVRTTLMPGLLKCLQYNRKNPIPQKVFEISDCVVLDPASETGAKNVRKVCAMVLDQSSNFEVIHGLLDMIMTKIGAEHKKNYKLSVDTKDPRFFQPWGVSIDMNGKKIGSMGVLHPEVLKNFELTYPVTCLEIDFDALFDHF